MPRSSAAARTALRRLATMIGASPSESSSASSSFGLRPRARASDRICCSPPEQSPARRSMIFSSVGKNPNATAKLVTDLASTGGFLKYGRDDEYEADRLGAKYLYAAGYDPQAMVDFLDKLKALETSEPSKFETWLMTHPPASDRLARVTSEVAGFPKLANPVRNAPAYAEIKAQLPR